MILIKPIIRLVKYWNAQNGHVFESYGLEQEIVEYQFYGRGFFGTPDLTEYFFEYMAELSLPWGAAQWKKDKVSRARTLINNAHRYRKAGNESQAEDELKKLLSNPDSGLAARTLLGGL